MSLTRSICDRAHTILNDADPNPTRQSIDGGTTKDRLPINPKLADARSHLKHLITSWARLISEEKPAPLTCPDELHAILAWIYQHGEWLDQHPAINDFETEIEEALTEILRCIDRGDNRIFCGVHAGQPIYARTGDKLITLPNGETHQVQTLRNQMKSEALDELLSAQQCAAVIRGLFGHPVTKKQIIKAFEYDQTRRDRGELGKLEGLDTAAMSGSTRLFKVEEVMTRLVWSRQTA